MPKGRVIYQSPHMSARFVEGKTERVVVSFPDRIHPLGAEQEGWAERFLSKRGISAIYIVQGKVDWFQCPDFFDAMRACRAFLGSRPVTAYGGSMGGYGAMLGAKTLGADLCFAMMPQFDIGPEVVPFEKRYLDFAKEIGPFRHRILQEVSRDCHYVVPYDPSHGKDQRHVTLLSQSYSMELLPVYRCGHGVLRYVKAANAGDVLADVLTGQRPARDLRKRIRNWRHLSLRYLQKMRLKAAERGHSGKYDYDHAIEMHGQLMPARPAGQKQLPRVVVHCGLPKTGTSSLQAYFFENAARYRADGVYYPTKNADKSELNHAWFSQELRDGSVQELQRTLAGCPPDCHTVFLSDESLFVELPGWTDGAKDTLAKALKGYQVELVLCQRDKAAWMRSFYLQAVQNRRGGPVTKRDSARNLWQATLPFDDFYQQPYCKTLLDFDQMHSSLKDVFQADKVTDFPFQSGSDVVKEFCKAMGWPHFKGEAPLAANPSITDTQGEILRQANGMGTAPGRTIKMLIELAQDPDTVLRPKRLARLSELVSRFDWQDVSFQQNPPLVVEKADFKAELERLQELAREVRKKAMQ